ncbi:MAG TPA: hypothetical protein VHS97_12880 [Isosphaeraceae bacterium]|nr:hypothetical protein [Isosphaeraceae bacterium]
MTPESGSTTRRDFARNALQSLTAFVLVEGLWSRRLLGEDVKPIVDAWFSELYAICRDVHQHRNKDIEFQGALERLYQQVDLKALMKTLDFDRLARGINFPSKGAKSLPVDFAHVGGLPVKLPFGGQIFAVGKGRSVVPHGHDNMATGFVVLKGDFRGRHYDRIEDHADHYIIRPTIDRAFQTGEFSTISDHKDNVHWFTAENETGFLFNIHVVETNPENPKRPGRVYVDPMGEKLAGGLIKAAKLSYGRVNQLYG